MEDDDEPRCNETVIQPLKTALYKFYHQRPTSLLQMVACLP